jgi:hypothetical protein
MADYCVAYYSKTGTTQDMADRIAEYLNEHDVSTEVKDLTTLEDPSGIPGHDPRRTDQRNEYGGGIQPACRTARGEISAGTRRVRRVHNLLSRKENVGERH